MIMGFVNELVEKELFDKESLNKESLTQFQNQFEEVDRPSPREQIGRGKISPTTTKAHGPQVAAKNEMLKQMNAIIADVTAGALEQTPIIATINCITTIPLPP